MRRIRPSIAARLLLMGGLLLLLMAAAVGFLQWHLEAARVELEAQQTEIAHQATVLEGQTNALKNQSSYLGEQLSSIFEQSQLVAEQIETLRGQQSLISEQADAVGSQWVVVESTIEFHSMRYWLLAYVTTRSDAAKARAEQHRDMLYQRLDLLAMMEVVESEKLDSLLATISRCERLAGEVAVSGGPAVTGFNQQVSRADACGDAVAKSLGEILMLANNSVIRANTSALRIAESAGKTGAELNRIATDVQVSGEAAVAESRLIVESTEATSAASERMNALADIVARRHESIQSTAFWALLVVSVLGAGLIAIFYKAIIGPIRSHATGMSVLARTDGDVPPAMDEGGPPELAEFAGSFNNLRTALIETVHSKDYIDNVLASMGEGLAVCGPDGRLRIANNALSALLGKPSEELTKRSLRTLFGDALPDIFGRAVSIGAPLSGQEIELQTPSGERSLLCSTAPFNDPNGQLAGSVCLFLDVTEHRKVERSNRIMASFPEQNPGPVMRLDRDGRVLYANPGSAPLLKKWAISQGQYVPTELLEPLATALATGEVERIRVEVDKRIYTLRISPQLHDGHANVFGFDESVQLRQETMKAARGEVLDQIASGAELEYVLDLLLKRTRPLLDGNAGVIALVNEASGALEITNIANISETCAQVLRTSCAGGDTGLGAAVAEGSVHRVDDLSAAPAWRYCAELFVRHGVNAHWSVPIRSTAGPTIGVVGLFFDQPPSAESGAVRLLVDIGEIAGAVVERYRSEQALASSEEKYRGLVEGSIQGLLVHRNLTPLFVNRPFVRMLGYDNPGQILDKLTVLDFFTPQERERLDEFFRQRMRGETTPMRYEVELQCRDGSVIIAENQVKIINWEGEPAIQATLIDITERKRAEHKLLYASEKALAAAKAKTQFLTTMSHELRTPLNGVLGILELMEDTHLDEEQGSLVQLALQSGELLLMLINDILDYSRLESGRMELESISIDLREIIAQVVDMMSPQAGVKQLELMTSVASDLPQRVFGDPLRVKQIITNLVSNAVKFTPQGTVKVAAAVKQRDAFSIRVEFQVIDSGIGISPVDCRSIFESFRQADNTTTRKFGGSGLGLAICQQLAGLMDGEISVKSELGKGSTFTAEIHFGLGTEQVLTGDDDDPPTVALTRRPIVTKEPQVIEADQEAATPARDVKSSLLAQHGEILVVDDNNINLTVTQSMLKRLGYQSSTASDGLEALKMLGECPFAMVLMDCQMPRMDGFETTRRIRESGKSYSDIPVVALTANAMAGDKEKCLAAGMDDYIGKPVNMDQLSTRVTRWLKEVNVGRGARLRVQRCDRARAAELARQLGAGFEEVLDLYLADAVKRIDNIRAALDQQSSTLLAAESSALKSASANVGAAYIYALAEQLQTQASAGDIEAVERLATELAENLQATGDELRAVYEENAA